MNLLVTSIGNWQRHTKGSLNVLSHCYTKRRRGGEPAHHSFGKWIFFRFFFLLFFQVGVTRLPFFWYANDSGHYGPFHVTQTQVECTADIDCLRACVWFEGREGRDIRSTCLGQSFTKWHQTMRNVQLLHTQPLRERSCIIFGWGGDQIRKYLFIRWYFFSFWWLNNIHDELMITRIQNPLPYDFSRPLESQALKPRPLWCIYTTPNNLPALKFCPLHF